MDTITCANLRLFMNNNPRWIPFSVTPEAEKYVREQAYIRNEHGKRMAAERGWRSRTPTNDPLAENISGIAGELCAHWAYGVPIGSIIGWSKEELNRGDLVSGDLRVEVKTSKKPTSNNWDLITNADQIRDKLDRPYVHVITALFPRVLILTGWAYGRDMMANAFTRRAGAGHEIYILDRRFLKDPMSLYAEKGLQVPELVTGLKKLITS